MKTLCLRWLGGCLAFLCVCGFPYDGRAQGPRSTTNINTLPNEATVGTTINMLAKKIPGGAGGKGQLRLPLATDTSISLYVVIANAGTTGSAVYVVNGVASCLFDSNTTGKAGSYVVASTTTPGRCHQSDTPPNPGMVIGTLVDDNTSTTVPSLIDANNQAYIPGSGTGTGTIQNVGLVMPAEFPVTGSPLSGSGGTITVSEITTTPGNRFYASPDGSTGAANFRAITSTDLSGLSVPVSGAAGGDLSGTFPNPVVFRASGTFARSGILDPPALAANVDNYNPTGFNTNSTIRIDGSTSDRDITGFIAPAAQPAGDRKTICNRGTTNNLVLRHQITSTPANQIIVAPTVSPGHNDSYTLLPGQCTQIWYDNLSSRWRLEVGQIPDSLRTRLLGVIVGDPDTTSPVLIDGNDTPNGFENDYGRPLRVQMLACRADNTGGAAPQIQIYHRGTANSILNPPTTACVCGLGTFTACNVITSTVAVINSFAADGTTCNTTPCGLDFMITAAGGAARYIVIKGRGLLQ